MAPLERTLELKPQARLDIQDVRAKAADVHGDAFDAYSRCLYFSPHTTAGYLSQSFAARLNAKGPGMGRYLELVRTAFPEGAGYKHDQLDLREDLLPEQREVEPTNGDSHLAFITGRLHPCVSYVNSRKGPVYFIDLDGVYAGTPRTRVTTLVGYDRETVVARLQLALPVSNHPVSVVSLKDPGLDLYPQIAALLAEHEVLKGRVRLALAPVEQSASLTVNEYETLLMQHDLTEVLRNPLHFAAEKVRHAWNDPRAVPGKALDYAKYDLVRAINQLMDAMGLGDTRVERLMARAFELPAERFLRGKRSVDLLVSDSRTPGRGMVVEGTYQTPILVQWRPAPSRVRLIDVTVTRFL